MKFSGYKALMLSLLVMSGVAAGAERASSQKITAQLLLFMTTDTNDDNRVSEEEYVGQKAGKAGKKARKEFRTLDDNSDGWLSAKEHSQRNSRYGFPR
ncbi:MAG TPA: hypothetical protein VGG64_19225 [Pirellulales bacterium]|jgi:hypothetical protein